MFLSLVQNNFICMPVTANCSELTCETFIGHASRPYNITGIHLVLTSSNTTSSDASRPGFPKILLNARLKVCLALLYKLVKNFSDKCNT
jgi:hypothetical protein